MLVPPPLLEEGGRDVVVVVVVVALGGLGVGSEAAPERKERESLFFEAQFSLQLQVKF